MKQLLKLTYRNFFRNKRRSIISGISVAIAIALIIFAQSYTRGITHNISDNIVRLLTGHIRITTREYERRERLIPLSEAIELTPQFYETLKDKDILYISPRIKFGVLLGRDELSIPALGYAIDPEKELKVSGLQKRIVEGSYLDKEGNSTIIGKHLAERLNLKVGDTLTILTRTAYDSPAGVNLVIKGIFSTGIGGVDRSLFYIPLKTGQELLDLNDRATEIVITIKRPERAVLLAQHIRPRFNNYSVVPFQYNPLLSYLNAFGIAQRFIYVIILIVACSTIANTMIMVVFERTREIGMMKAMGMTNLMVVGLLIIEAGMIGAVGSFIGTCFGSAMSYFLKYQGIDITMISSTSSVDMPYGPIIYFAPTPFVVFSSFVIGLIATIVVALLPISRITKLVPAKALRSI